MYELETLIRAVPDFPQPGILFRDITPLLLDPEAFNQVIGLLAAPYESQKIDRVVAIESRGFIFGAPLALRLGCGLALVRKLGKLPGKTVAREYSLEYGTNHLEMHLDSLDPGNQVVVVDDVLATGGTARAAVDLVQQMQATVAGVEFLIELKGLNGRRVLSGFPLHSILTY
jgi:adenine phosphoribosyltransferase